MYQFVIIIKALEMQSLLSDFKSIVDETEMISLHTGLNTYRK